MSPDFHVTFVVAVNSREVLEQNLLASPCLRSGGGHQILIQENYSSAAAAYNDALPKAVNNLIVFIHQDLFLPSGWLSQVEENLRRLEEKDPGWGVAGCWGARADGELCGHVYSSGWGVLGREFDQPAPVQTLDEIVLIIRKDSGLSFDETLPHFHFYGTDICMQAASRGRGCYAISAFCIHNTRQLLNLPEQFYNCYAHVKRVWKDRLPIQTSCIRISLFDTEVYRRRLEDFCRAAFLHSRQPADRVMDPSRILKQLEYSEG
jgi:Glycosyltransferase like family